MAPAKRSKKSKRKAKDPTKCNSSSEPRGPEPPKATFDDKWWYSFWHKNAKSGVVAVQSHRNHQADTSNPLVTEQLTFIYEECLEGNYKSIEHLRKSVPGMHATSQSRRVIVDSEAESSDAEASDMMVDEPVAPTSSVEKPVLKEMTDKDKWMVVRPKRIRRKKTG